MTEKVTTEPNVVWELRDQLPRPTCRGGRPIAECRAILDHPASPAGERPGWSCAQCGFPPGTKGSLAAPADRARKN